MTTEREDDAQTARSGPGNGPANGAEAEPATDDPARLRELLEEERERAQGYMQSWQRAAADYQNFKRRVEEERSEVGRLANAALVINLLPIVDDMELALNNVDTHLAGLTWVDGIRLIHRKFQALLEMAGVKEIEAEGRTFDPAEHEAVAQVPGDENKVVSVVQKGYRLGERVIRPAMVVVGNGQQAQ